MNKNALIPIALFFLSMILTPFMLTPVVLLVVGLGLVTSLVAGFEYRAGKIPESKLGTNLLFRSWLAVIAGAIVAYVFLFGLFLFGGLP